MKTKINILFLLFSFSFLSAFSQIDNSTKGKSKGTKIPLTIKNTNPLKKTASLNLNSHNGFKNAHKKAQKRKTLAEKELELKNKGILSKEKIREANWNKAFKTINGQYKRVDQHLGDFRSDSKYVRIICRDFQYPDGDRVTIFINDIPAVYNIVLTQAYQEFKIPLVKGVNKIAFKALNQGTSGPNTAGFKVYDDASNLISKNEWNLATGAVASLLIVKNK